MITRLTGVLSRVLDEEARVVAGPFEYQLLVPEFVRRVIQMQQGKEIAFHTMHYLDGDPSRGKVVPRLVGFLHEADLEFFELFCTVDGIGTKKALKALARNVKDIADAIQRQDSKWLQTLPGVGASSADKIVAALRRKVTRFSLAPTAPVEGEPPPSSNVDAAVLEEAYLALLSLGNTPLEARTQLDSALADGKSYASSQEIIAAVYKKK
ncbi:MAG: ATP-dependent DNA helicase RuvA [Gemmataceae bacterium]|nr:ATP-dependent DNA helicase RuvA [Gemmataceae bacterium]